MDKTILKALEVSALFALLVFASSCGAGSETPEPLKQVTVIQSSVAPGDPHIVSDSANRLSILYSIYESLVKLGDEGSYRPSLAESWSVEDDARTWTFRLRSGVTFHNGETLTANDVVATLGRVLDPSIGGSFGTQGVYISYLGEAEIAAVDDSTVTIVTPEPMADLLDLIVAMPISPASALANLPDTHVGSGPYELAEQSEDRLILTAHRAYWGPAPPYDEIQWIAEPDSAKRVDALLAGEADIAARVGIDGKRRLAENGEATVREVESGLAIIYMLNAQDGPCQDPRVRQALNYALDVDAIIQEIKEGAASPLNGYLTPLHFGYNPETPVYPYDPDEARRLLADAGYGEGLELTFDIPSVMPDEAPALTQMMIEQYAQVGITVEVIVHEDRPGYAEMVREKKIHDACAFDSSPRSTYRVLREKIQSTRRGPWWQGYESERVNELIGEAETRVSDTERRVIYREIYSIVRDDAPWIFLYNPTNYWGAGSILGGWSPSPDGLILLF